MPVDVGEPSPQFQLYVMPVLPAGVFAVTVTCSGLVVLMEDETEVPQELLLIVMVLVTVSEHQTVEVLESMMVIISVPVYVPVDE